MFDVGGGEFLLIIIAIVVLFGPKKLPEMARNVGKGIAYLRRAQSDFERSVHGLQSEIDAVVDIKGDKKKANNTASAGQADNPTNTTKTLPADPPEKIDTSQLSANSTDTTESTAKKSTSTPETPPPASVGHSSDTDAETDSGTPNSKASHPGLSAIRPADGMVTRQTANGKASHSDGDSSDTSDKAATNHSSGKTERRKQA